MSRRVSIMAHPAPSCRCEAHASVAVDDNPFPKESDFSFGMADEEFSADRKDIDVSATDADGKATVSLELSDLPKHTKQLAATVDVSVFEPSGRPVGGSLTRPIRERPLAIGVRLSNGDDDNGIAEDQPTNLEIIALDQAGKRVAAKGLRWELLGESWEYAWYSQDGRWRHRVQVRDRPLETGTVDAGADPAKLSRKLPAGRYRWEVTDLGTGAQSSVRFHVGWWTEGALPDVPDKLSTTLDKPSYQAGETAKLFIKAPFAGEAEVAIASDKVLALRSVTLPAEGATIELPVDAGWGTGVYALVSAYRPQGNASPIAPKLAARGPARAVGVAWLGIDAAPRRLTLALAGPDVARPRGPVDIPVKVSGARGRRGSIHHARCGR